MTREVMQQALEALENHEGNYKLENAGCDRQEAAITAIKEALAQSEQEEQQQQENPSLIEWKEKGEEIMAQAGIGFHLGAWWADRPWRQK